MLFGAVLTAEDGRVEVGRNCVVMENALVRGRGRASGDAGRRRAGRPAGARQRLRDRRAGRFIADGGRAVPGRAWARCEVRIHGVVHVNTVLAPCSPSRSAGSPAGDPAQLFPPEDHDALWAVQRELDFPGTVYGVERGTPPEELMRDSEFFGAHREASAASELTTLRLGGPAGSLVDARTDEELLAAVRGEDDPLLLAGGSNLVVADGGFPRHRRARR